MTSAANDPIGNAELIPATAAHEPVLANLLQLYAHDFSEFHAVEIGEDGRFSYNQLPLYFKEPERHAFLIAIEGKPAGFVLVKQGSEFTGNRGAWDMAEFFILRGHRRRGLGRRMAQQVWGLLPGPWEVRVMRSNSAALDFWGGAIADFTGRTTYPITIEKAGEAWHLFQFESKTLLQISCGSSFQADTVPHVRTDALDRAFRSPRSCHRT